MARKHRNIDARTLNLKTGDKSFIIKKKAEDEVDGDEDFEEEEVKYDEDELNWLNDAENRQEDLSQGDLEKFNLLSTKYQDAMSRSIDNSIENVLPGEQGSFGDEGTEKGETSSTDIDQAKMRESEQTERSEPDILRRLLTQQMMGKQLSDEEEQVVESLRGKYPDLFNSINAKEMEIVGLDPETGQHDNEITTTEDIASMYGVNIDGHRVRGDFLNEDTEEVDIDPAVATEDERYGKDFGALQKEDPAFKEFLKENLAEHRQWLQELQQEQPSMDMRSIEMNLLLNQRAPLYYTSGERSVSPSDIKGRSKNVLTSLRSTPGMEARDVETFSRAFKKIIENPSNYNLNKMMPEFQDMLIEKGVDPSAAIETAGDIHEMLTRKKSLEDFYWLEKAKLLEDRMKDDTKDSEIGGKPIPEKYFDRNYEKIQSLIDNLGYPLDLVAITGYVDEFRSDKRWRNHKRRGLTEDGHPYTIDPPESLVASYNLIAQSPLPDKIKKRVAKILMDPRDYRLQTTEGGKRIPQSKLESVMKLLSNSAMVQYGLGVHKDGWKGMSGQDELQRMEQKLWTKTYDELTDTLQNNFKLTHGQALDYLRNTKEGLDLFFDVMNDKGTEAKDQWEKSHGFRKILDPETRTHKWVSDNDLDSTQRKFVQQFPYGPSEMFLLLNSLPENRDRNPNQPYVNLTGPETDAGVLKDMRRLYRKQDMFKQMFPGTMRVPTKVTDPETGETRLESRERPRSQMISDPAELEAMKMMIENERKRSGDRPPRAYSPMGYKRKRSELSLRRSIKSLTLRRKTLSLETGLPTGEYYQKAHQGNSVMDMINNLADSLGLENSDLMGDLRHKLDKKLQNEEKANKIRPDVDALYQSISSGYKGEFPIPNAAQQEAKEIMMNQDMPLWTKYQKLDNLWRYRINLPDDDEISAWQSEHGRYTQPPEAAYTPPMRPTPEAVQRSMETGESLGPAPKPRKETEEAPQKYHTSLGDPQPDARRETPDLSKERGKTKFDFSTPGEWVTVPPTTLKETLNEEPPAQAKTPIDKNLPPGQDDILENDGWDQLLADINDDEDEGIVGRGALSLRRRLCKSLSFKNRKKKADEFEEELPEEQVDDGVVIPSESGNFMTDMYEAAGDEVREDFLHEQDPEFKLMQHVLRDLKKTPMTLQEAKQRYQGDQTTPGIFDWPIIDRMSERGFIETEQQDQHQELGQEDDIALEELPTEEVVQEDTAEAIIEASTEESIEHVALTDEGRAKLTALQKMDQAGMNAYPDLTTILHTIDSYNREGVPIRSQEELESILQRHPDEPGSIALQHAGGDNPDAAEYIGFFNDLPGQFDKPAQRGEKLVEDKSRFIRDMFSRGPISEDQWSKLDDEEQGFLEDLRTPEVTDPNMHSIYSNLLHQYTDFQNMDLEPDASFEDKSAYHVAETKATHAIDLIQRMQDNGLKPDSPVTLNKLMDASFIDDVDKRFLNQELAPNTQKMPFSKEFFRLIHRIAYPGIDQSQHNSIRTIDEVLANTKKSLATLSESRNNPGAAIKEFKEQQQSLRDQIKEFDQDINRINETLTLKKVTDYDIKNTIPYKNREALLRQLAETESVSNSIKEQDPEKIDSQISNLVNSIKKLRSQKDEFLRGTDEPELWATPESQMARRIIDKRVIPNPDILAGRHWEMDPLKLPGYFNEGNPMGTRFWEEREKWMPAKKKRTISTLRLNADTYGPGGPDWSYEFTSGPTPAKENKEKRKKRFPWHNKPSEDLSNPKGSDQGNFINSTPGVQNMDNLEATIEGMSKTADNDLFEIYSYNNGNDNWMSFTLFKNAYSKFKKGDVVVQYGKTSSDSQTFRRRFGSIAKANSEKINVIRLVWAVLNSGTSTPDDSLHDIQTGKPGMGPYKKRVDYDAPEGPSNRDGFNRPKNRRKEDSERSVFPYEDQTISNQTQIFGEVGNYAAPITETPEERAAKPEQDIPKPINMDPKRPFPNKRKRTNPNESWLTGQPGGQFQEHHSPLNMQNLSTTLTLKKVAEEENV